MITEPEYLEELEMLEEGKKNKAPSVAAKSRKRGNIQSKSTKKKKKKKRNFLFIIFRRIWNRFFLCKQ